LGAGNIAYGNNLPYNGIGGDIDLDRAILSAEPVLGNIGGVVESNREYIRNIGTDLWGTPKTAEEHWARNELNFLLTSDIEYYENEENGWTEYPSIGTIYPSIGLDDSKVRKFVSQDGHCEAVFYGDKLLLLDKNQPNYEKLKDNAIIDPVNAGTYNYYPNNAALHHLYDVDPYIEWGNCPTDVSTKEQRKNALFE